MTRNASPRQPNWNCSRPEPCGERSSYFTNYCPEPISSGPKVVLVIDNYIIHKSEITQATLDKNADRLEVFALPTRSCWACL